MCLALNHFYEKHQEHLVLDPVIARLFTEFFEHFETLKLAVQSQGEYTSEAAKQKQFEEDEMIEATVRLSSKGYVYANEKKLYGLLEKFSWNSANLQKLSDVRLHSVCLSIYETLREIDPANISEYGIAPGDLDLLKKEIDDFYGLISRPRANIITRSQSTAKIDEIVVLMKSLLKQRLDKMIYSLPAERDNLKREYKAARIIISIPGKKAGSEVEPEQAES